MKTIRIFFFILVSLFFIRTLIFAADKVEVAILSFPQEITSGQEFDVGFTVKKTNALFDSFYYKGRLGITDFSQGETYNILSDKWLSDSSAWNNYFSSILNENGVATLTAKLRTKTTIATGTANLQIRVNLNGTNYDSPAQTITINQTVPTITPELSSILTPTLLPSTSTPIPPTPTALTTPTTIYQVPTNNVYISEVMVYPETADQEWIEFYNNNDFPVTLKDWYIDDLESAGSSPKKFSLDIQAKSYEVYNLSFSMFNNDGDQVRLLDANKNVIDSFEYVSSDKNITWARINFATDEFCPQQPTKNQVNFDYCFDSPTSTVQSSVTTTNIPSLKPTLTKSLVSPTKIKIINSPKLAITQIVKPKGMVLGTTDILTNKKIGSPLNKSLSFLGTAFPFLTILSLFFKMKKYAAA